LSCGRLPNVRFRARLNAFRGLTVFFCNSAIRGVHSPLDSS
jgi:hypothetical protein